MEKDKIYNEFKAIFYVKMKSKGCPTVTNLAEHLGLKPGKLTHFFQGDYDLKKSEIDKVFDFLEMENVYKDLFIEEIKIEPRYRIKRKEVENGKNNNT